MKEIRMPEVELRRVGDTILARPDDGTDGPWWTWDELMEAMDECCDLCCELGLI